jgi:hypothetical protein
MSAFESAIDDSFDPPPQPIEDEEADDESFFDNAYNGPRDGRWEVASSVGSFVDDRCPTVYGYRSQARPAGREPRINDGLVKKLMQATIEQKRAEAATRDQQTATVNVAPTDNGKVSSAPPSVKISRPFIVPLLRNEPLGPVMASYEKARELSHQPPPATRQTPKAHSESRATATREVAPPKTEVAKAKSDTPRIVTPDRSTIRILGKNGEEAFVSLPSLAKSVLAKTVLAASHKTQQRSVSAAPVSGSHRSAVDIQSRDTVAVPEAVEPKEQEQKQNQKQNQQHNQKVKQNQKTKEQNLPQDNVEQLITESPQAEGSQRAASWVMSGALPAPSPAPLQEPTRESSRAPLQAVQSTPNSLRDSGIAMSDFLASMKHASSRASTIRPESSVSQGVMSIAQQIAKMPSTTSSARNSKPKSTASGSEGFKEIGRGMTTGYPAQERTSERSDRERVKKVSSSRHSAQPSVRSHSGSVQQQDEGSRQGTVLSSRHSSQPSIRSHPGSVQQQDEGRRQRTVLSSRHSSQPSTRGDSGSVQLRDEGSKQGSVLSSRYRAQPSARSHSASIHQQDEGSKHGSVLSSRHSSQPSVKSHSGSVQQQHEGGMQETLRSNYKPPTVVSASSSASITHSFGGTYMEGFVPHDQYVLLGQEAEVGFHSGGSNRSEGVRSGSVRNSANDASDVAGSEHSRSSSHGRRSDKSVSVRSEKESSIHSGANYVFDVKKSRSGSQAHHSDESMSVPSERGSSTHSGANYVSDVRHSRSGSQAHHSDHSSSTRSDKGGSVQSGASHASSGASSRPKKSGFQATSMASHSKSDRTSQASGTRCPSHSPVSPLAPSPPLISPGQEKTKSAGPGWISPHPCSTPIYVSVDGPGHVGTLTYSEWRAQREGLKSNAGSYACSHVPSAVGLQPLPQEVYGHPPPASYVGSYNPDPKYASQPVPQMDGASECFSPLQGANAMHPSASVHSQQGSMRSRSSLHSHQDSPGSHSSSHSHSGGPSTSHNNSLYNQPVNQAPIAALQDAGWSFPPQDGRPTSSNRAPAYNFGLTPTELSIYQSKLGNTISRHSSQLSQVQDEQTQPHPDYEVWNSGQSHHSSRRSSSSQHSMHSIHNFPPNLSYPRVKSQLPMPWDPTMSLVNARSVGSARQVSSPVGSSWRGSDGGVGGVESRLPSNASSSRGSVRSRESFGLADSQVTYGSAAWEKLEDAEDGRGAYQVPEGSNLW